MNSTNANIINSVCLIVIGLWGYFEVSSPTALIPVGFGAVLILCTPGVKKQNFLKAAESFNMVPEIHARVFLMIGTSALSMVYFIGSFIAARKAREKS